MIKQERYNEFIRIFSDSMPEAETELEYSNEYELIVSVILSAQCTDKRVNIITKEFFKTFPNPLSLSEASIEEIFEHIKTCSYPNNKSKSLLGMANMLIKKYDGKLPEDVDEMQKLPGVGRKTANVLASVLFNKAAMAVDTHVFRVSERIGLTTNAKNPLQAEKQLVKYFPDKLIHKAHHWLILHGRYVCKARKPLCRECKITHICKYFRKNE